MNIKGILVTMCVPMNNHIANGGEKILGNASSIKQRPDGRVYISGQKQRHTLFSAIERLNFSDKNRANTYVSNGDGVNWQIENDLRGDLGGFLHLETGYMERRTSPLTATPAVAINPSEIGRDLLVRFKVNADSNIEQGFATKEYSQEDVMLMNFFIDVGAVSIRKHFNYENEIHLSTKYVKHVTEVERLRRIKLALEATSSLTDYSNQARNAVSGEPQQVLIVFDSKLSRKASRYFLANDTEKRNILNELDKREAKYFLGDDTKEGDSVAEAYEKALNFLSNQENSLFDPTNNTSPITSVDFRNNNQ